MNQLPDDIRREAVQAFLEYERIVMVRLLDRPTWKLDASPLEKVLATGDEQKVLDFIHDLERRREETLKSTSIQPPNT